jgi:hypothetical protein
MVEVALSVLILHLFDQLKQLLFLSQRKSICAVGELESPQLASP